MSSRSGRDINRDEKGRRKERQQSGCMSGIFQLFDRRHHHFLTAGQPLNTLPPPPIVAAPLGQNAIQGNEICGASDKSTPVQEKVAIDKQNVPTVSSTSLSSSCSSTFSSVECDKKAHPEPLSSRHYIFLETQSPNFPVIQTRSSHPDMQQLIKDPIYREARVISVKKEDGKGRAMRHIDSPRPLLQSKPVQPIVTHDGSIPPRFSYDGRVSQYSMKSTVTIKDLPRLSLDSRERSIRRGAAESRSNFLTTDIKMENEPGSNKRPSGVVARLMGLEAFPDSTSQEDDDLNTISRFSDESRRSQLSRSPRVVRRSANSVKNPTSNSRFPLEPAPWGSPKPRYEHTENNCTKIPQSVGSLYGQTERRLKEPEFQKPGKQISGALEKIRKRLEKDKEKLPSNVESRESKYSSKNPVSRFETEQRHLFPSTIKVTGSPRRDGYPSSLKKLSKDLNSRYRHSGNPSNQPLDLMEKKSIARIRTEPLSSKAPQHVAQNPANIRRISGTVSPKRLQQTKDVAEKQVRPISPSDLRRGRRQPSKQRRESLSPTRKLKPKSTDSALSDDQSRGLTSESRNLSQSSDAISVQSESSISFVSQFDTEVTSIYRPNDEKFEARLSEDKSIAEQPSPVSVLDATFYAEGSPSPVRKISNTFEDDETAHYIEGEWEKVEIDHLLNTRLSLSSKFNNQLVHKLILSNSSDGKANIDHFTSLCNTNPDHKYVTDILLASGLLQDSSTKSHPAGHFINPELFKVLEKRKGETKLTKDGKNRNIKNSESSKKIRRKLLFDTVNEILGHKLGSSIFPKVERKRSSGEKLLEEVWLEVVKLQSGGDRSVDNEDDDGLTSILSADMMNQSNEWTEYVGNFSGLVLDIERLIFKDLIREIVKDGAADPKERQKRHCRKLFST